MNDGLNKIAIFRKKEIRRIVYRNEWWFSVIDVITALTDSVNPRDYWFKMKIRVKSEDGVQLSTICRQLKMEAPDGKMRQTDVANTEGLFRIIQSIPSPKAEPFKRWLARVTKPFFVIASEAWRSFIDCFVATAPRNDDSDCFVVETPRNDSRRIRQSKIFRCHSLDINNLFSGYVIH